MAHSAPVPQPPLEGGEIGPTRERCTLPARRRAVAVRGDPPGTVEQGQIGLLLRQHREEIAERGEDCRANSPPIAVAHREQRGLPQDVARGHAGR